MVNQGRGPLGANGHTAGQTPHSKDPSFVKGRMTGMSGWQTDGVDGAGREEGPVIVGPQRPGVDRPLWCHTRLLRPNSLLQKRVAAGLGCWREYRAPPFSADRTIKCLTVKYLPAPWWAILWLAIAHSIIAPCSPIHTQHRILQLSASPNDPCCMIIPLLRHVS